MSHSTHHKDCWCVIWKLVNKFTQSDNARRTVGEANSFAIWREVLCDRTLDNLQHIRVLMSTLPWPQSRDLPKVMNAKANGKQFRCFDTKFETSYHQRTTVWMPVPCLDFTLYSLHLIST